MNYQKSIENAIISYNSSVISCTIDLSDCWRETNVITINSLSMIIYSGLKMKKMITFEMITWVTQISQRIESTFLENEQLP